MDTSNALLPQTSHADGRDWVHAKIVVGGVQKTSLGLQAAKSAESVQLESGARGTPSALWGYAVMLGFSGTRRLFDQDARD